MADTPSNKFDVRDIKPEIGTIVESDKETLLSGQFGPQIYELIRQRGVVVFPQISFTDEEQIAFSKTVGTFAPEMRGDVFKISMDKKINPQADYVKGAFYWHIDGTMEETPIFASILSAKVLAAEGGNTGFCNTYAAWEALPEAEKEQLDGLRVIHAFYNAQLYVEPEPSYDLLKQWMALGTNELPLVWTHMDGRKSLVLGSTADQVVGMGRIEGLELLTRLRDWCTQDRFSLSHQWSVGDLVIWDNTGTMHRAEAYPFDSNRLMHRTKLAGEERFS